MGIISSLSTDDNKNNIQIIEEIKEPQEKEPQDNIKKSKSNKKPRNNTTKQNRNPKKNLQKNIFPNKIIKTKNPSGFSLNTLQAKRPKSPDKPIKEIKNIIFQNKKKNELSQKKNSNSNKKKTKKRIEIKKNSIN